MNPSDIFRSFIGLPRKDRIPDESSPVQPHDFYPFFGGGINSGNNESSEQESPLHHGIFNCHFDDMMKEMDEMFHNLESVMKGMGGFSDFQKDFHYTLPSPPNGNDTDSVRDLMLKEPDGLRDDQGCNGCAPNSEVKDKPRLRKWEDFSSIIPRNEPSKKDTDIDGEKDLDQIFGSSSTEKNWEVIPSVPQPKSHFRSVFVRTVRTPDGKIEEHRTVKDESGKEETTITRKLDDQTHSVTTRKHADGKEDIFENYTNVDERNKEEFEGKWNLPNIFNSRGYKQPNLRLLKPEDENELDQEKSSIFKKLFGHNFPGWKS